MKNEKIKISIVIPAYNEAKYIGQCLKSLENQTLPRNSYEIIVVDGNSKDKTREIALKYADFVLIEKEKSVGKARNTGCKKASGEIIANTDADTIVQKDWLKKIQKDLSGKNVVAVYGAGLLYDGGWFPNFLSRFFYTPFVYLNHFIGRPNFVGFNSAVKKDAAKKVGFFNPRSGNCEDIDIARKLMKIGKVKLDTNLIVHTSIRRIKKYGYWEFVRYNMHNYFRYNSTGAGDVYISSH